MLARGAGRRLATIDRGIGISVQQGNHDGDTKMSPCSKEPPSETPAALPDQARGRGGADLPTGEPIAPGVGAVVHGQLLPAVAARRAGQRDVGAVEVQQRVARRVLRRGRARRRQATARRAPREQDVGRGAERPPPPSLPYKVDTSRPSLRTNWTRLAERLGKEVAGERERLVVAQWLKRPSAPARASTCERGVRGREGAGGASRLPAHNDPLCRRAGRAAHLPWGGDEARPVSTGGGTRRVQLVREGEGGPRTPATALRSPYHASPA